MPHSLKSTARALPQSPGVYLFKQGRSVLYVGKAINLRSRTLSYFTGRNLPKTEAMVSEATVLDHILVSSELEALLLETKLIQHYQPKYNLRSKDDKSPLYIKFTNHLLPRVVLDRKRSLGPKAVFFGPFPTTTQARRILKILRRVFPFCTSFERPGRACFHSHLGLCRPCPSVIESLTDTIEKQALTRQYKKNIQSLRRILSGRSSILIKSLRTSIAKLALAERFEEAALVRDQLLELEYLFSKPISVAGYLDNPQLLEDIRAQEAEALAEFLANHTQHSAGRVPSRIEAYDISRSGTDVVVGAMVVFVNGEPDKASYRKFRIRDKRQIADPKFLAEVLERRLRHPEWPTPDLILLDGGTPQVNSIRKLFQEKGIHIPLLGLAKGEETIVWYHNGIKRHRLPLSSPALKLLQRLRDEAHRFGHGYQDWLSRRRNYPGRL